MIYAHTHMVCESGSRGRGLGVAIRLILESISACPVTGIKRVFVLARGKRNLTGEARIHRRVTPAYQESPDE